MLNVKETGGINLNKQDEALKREMSKQKKEHKRLPEKYLRMISKDHLRLKSKGKRNYG